MTQDAGLRLRLLGTQSFVGEGAEQASSLLSKPKSFALLAYIATAGNASFRRRDDILARFWPEADTARARNALRQSLFLLKQHLPEGTLLSRGQEEVGLRGVDVDVVGFEANIAASREREAIAMYGGPFLDGFRLYGESDFDVWVSMERERLQHRAVRSAIRSAMRAAKSGAAGVAELEGLIDFAVTQAPYDEALIREVVELLESAGDHAGASRFFAAAAERFRSALGIPLSPETERAAPRPRAVPVAPVPPDKQALLRPRAVSPEARRLHMQARHLAGLRSPVTIMQAIDCFERAVALSEDYAEAHAGLAFALCQAVVYVDYPGTDAWPRAKAHALRATRLDPKLGDAHAVLAHVTLCYDYDWTTAERLYRRALEADPASSIARQSYPFYFLTSVGRIDEALEFLNRARDDMPDNSGMSVYYIMALILGRRFERARQEAQFLVDAQPALVQGHWVLGMAHEGLGAYEAAVACFEHGVATTGRSALFLSQLGRAAASAGDRTRATAILHELDARGGDSGPALYNSAEILTALGEHEQAIDRLYTAYRQRNAYMVLPVFATHSTRCAR